jgi:hypothetical protein
MKTVISSYLLCLALLLIGTAANAQIDYLYSSEPGKFTIQFPSEFSIKETDNQGTVTTEVSCEYDDGMLIAGFTIHSEDLNEVEELAKISADSFQESLEADVISSKVWHYRGYKGIKAKYSIAEIGYTVEYRVIIRGNIQYQLVHLFFGDSSVNSDELDFFDSFNITE